MERCGKLEAVAGQDGKAVEVGKEFVNGEIAPEGSLSDC
jgi:hypothetical protein